MSVQDIIVYIIVISRDSEESFDESEEILEDSADSYDFSATTLGCDCI